MRFYHLIAAIALLFVHTAQATSLTPDLNGLNALPLRSVAEPLIRKALADAQSLANPTQFAVALDLPLTLQDGRWQTLGDGQSQWRTRVRSPGAQSLNFMFSRFHLPEGAALWIYDSAGALVQGPFTKADETPEGTLWTPIVMGDSAVIELRAPAAVRDQVQLQLGKLNHGYREFGKADAVPAKAASTCETDVICPAGDNWRKEIRSVASITIGGNVACSGSLLNNVRQDDTPYFLTANHCGINSSNASSVVFYWNYQSPSCGAHGGGSRAQNQSGSSFVSNNANSDYTLIKLNKKPSSAFNVYLSGWNAGGSATAPGAVIHQPGGYEKSISLFNTDGSPSTVTLCDGSPVIGSLCLGTSRSISAWQINYSQGITEPGSSGSGLWDTNHRIVGQLAGGSSSCSNLSGTDYYGRFDLSFVANNNALKNTLDPDNTGTLSLCGKDLGAASCAINPSSSTSSSSGNTGGNTGGNAGNTSSASASTSAGKSSGGALNLSVLLGLMALRLLGLRRKR